MTGQMLVYIGIAAVGLIGEILVTVIFAGNKKKMIRKIYDSYEK